MRGAIRAGALGLAALGLLGCAAPEEPVEPASPERRELERREPGRQEPERQGSEPAAEVQGPRVVGRRTLLLETRSDYSRIRLRQEGTVRTLWFVNDDGREVKETQIDLSRPHALLIPYTRAMFVSHLLRPSAPRRCLLVGLGGGAMVHFLARHFPQTELDAVEIDPVVVEIAAEWFGTRPGPRTRIHTADGFVYLAEAKAEGRRWDAIYMDAYLKPAEDTDSRGLQLRLKTERFFTDLGGLLAPGGVVVFNILRSPALAEDLRTIRRVFRYVHVVEGWGRNVIVAASHGAPPSPLELEERALALQARELGVDFSQLARALRQRCAPQAR